ncbi:MAG: sialidase family protein [Bryobacteraceae bacterium]
MKAGTVTFPALALAFAATQSPIFESRPRVVTEGRDPIVSVRASGALSLMKVDKGDLWVQQSFDGGDSFEPGIRVNDVPGEVSSHAESSPQMQIRTRSEFYCLWQKRRPDGEGSTLRFARSMNWGESFSKAIDLDPTSTSQSFFSLDVAPNGVIYAAWLDGRDRGKGRPGSSAVYVARSLDKGKSFEKPVRVALDVCPCCRPGFGFDPDGTVFVSWRAVLDDNVRDIFVSASTDGGLTWQPRTRVAEDNWVLNGCPHSGASMTSIGKRMFIAWHSVREKQPALALSYSDDRGKTFSRRILISEGILDPNHPFLSQVGDRIGIVFQGRPTGKQQGWAPVSVYYREVDSEGRLSPLQSLGQAGSSASYPVFAFEEPERLFVAWTESVKDGKSVVMARGRRAIVPVAGAPHAK